MTPVTVIMRSKNSDWVIGQALAALFSQTFTDFELLVVDSGSTDRTLDLAAAYPHRLHRIEAGDYYPGTVLNDAIRNRCESDLLVFLNSDCVLLCPQALERLIVAFDDPTIAAAFGRQIPRPEACSWVRRDYAVSFPVSGATPPWITLSLPVAAVRRSAWEAHPFYSDAWGSEDTEWGNWARKNSVRIAYVPNAIAMHSHNYTLRQIYGRRFIEGEADAFIYGGQEGFLPPILRTAGAASRDILFGLRERSSAADIVLAPTRRAVSEWAYHRGRRHGEKRRKTGNPDSGMGQRIVLARHESAVSSPAAFTPAKKQEIR